MKMQDTKLNECYAFALNQASGIEAECNVLSDDFPKGSVLYKKATAGSVIVDILSLILGFALFLLGVASFFSEAPLNLFKLSFPGKYVSVVLIGMGVTALFSGIFSLYRIIMLARAKHKAKTVRQLGMSVAKEAKNLDTFAQQVQDAMSRGEDLTVMPSGFWQTQFLDIKATVAEKGRLDNVKNQRIQTIAAGALFAFAAIAFYPFIVGGYALKYGDVSGALVAISYIIQAVIISESLFRLERWYHAKIKLIAGAAFGAYQIAIVLGLLLNKTFASLFDSEGSLVVEKLIFNYPILSLILISLIMVFIITGAKYDLIALRVEEESYTRDMSDNTTQTVKLKRQKTKIRYKCMIKIPFVIAMGVWMGGIVEKGLSFGNVLLYIVIAAFYFGITFTMDMDESFNYVYGSLSKYLRLMLFAGYVTVALSLIPDFGVGTVILIGIHGLASMGGPAVTVNEKKQNTAPVSTVETENSFDNL